MTDDASVQLQALIDRMQDGDREARRQLLERTHGRLRRLAASMLHGSFPALQARHELDSIVHETWLRLVLALDKVQPPTVADFFRLAAHKVRQVLLDMADRQRRQRSREVLARGDSSQGQAILEGSDQTHDPARLALWTEFHQKVKSLNEDERAVFDLHYYLDLPQVEVARLLNLHPRKVSYLWVAATEKLADGLADGIP